MAEVNLTRHQRANLAKLAAYLRTLPKDYPDFEMRMFVDGDGGHPLSRAHVAKCGTAACAAGHGPRAGIRPHPAESWLEYSNRAFVQERNDEYAWEWVFSGEWSEYDNTVHGAAARIEYMLERGIPSDWSDNPDEDFVALYADRIAAVPA